MIFKLYSDDCISGAMYHSQERMTVNHDATGSSPVTGATLDKSEPIRWFGFVRLLSRTTCVRISCSLVRNNLYKASFITFKAPIQK